MPHSGGHGGSATTAGAVSTSPDPKGTCYTAEAALITLLEAWSGIDVIARPELAGRDISEVTARRELRLADATSNRASQCGVTSKLFATTDYALIQQWAQTLRDAGFDGIRYWARHDLHHVHACLAVFAASDDRTGTVLAPTNFTVLGTENLLDRPDLWKALEDEAGIVVLDIPASL